MMGHPAYANRRRAIEAAPGQPYEPFSTDEFLAWRRVDFDVLPLLSAHPPGPASWELLQLELVPQEHQLGAWARAARAVFDHIEENGGQAALARLTSFDQVLVALYRRRA